MSSCLSGCEACPSKAQCKSAREPLEIEMQIERTFKDKKIIAVASGKGGVGKSTIAASLALKLSKKKSVTLIDLDIAGSSIGRITGAQPSFCIADTLIGEKIDSLMVITPPEDLVKENVPGMSILKYLSMINVESEYLVLDTPPGTSDVHIALGKYLKNTNVIMVSTSHPLSLSDTRREIDFCKKASLNILGLIENMSETQCAHCSHSFPLYQKTNIKDICAELSVPYLFSVPMNREATKSSDAGGLPDVLPDEINQLIFDTFFASSH
ncbi:hypothetical protein NEFER03_1063 [Nematocida sp. LUAm3]|nr:hypothetical protein NEFER03_1063 [Nematocida sp. LUAm3]KAI5175332.1 hypothetical protein NEFER02_1261 [Nematocida sp. LUAm2]KAI5177711.1 hypothetical protein NEFER01_0935 [Nematocida sp. LUAm1]